jgi:HPt (histidine-containing phosphotransfer) domain-containing protein
VAAVAHKLKGAAQTVDANGVAACVAALEDAGKAGDPSHCRKLLTGSARVREVLAKIEEPSGLH